MKNKFLILSLLLLTSYNCAFAIQDSKVVSEIKETPSALFGADMGGENFFTPVLTKEQKEALKNGERGFKQVNKGLYSGQMRGTIPPVKRLRLYILKSMSKDKMQPVEEVAPNPNQALLDCETMEYFPEKTELQAEGKVVMFFPKNNSTIKADKLIYNQTTNLIKAYGDVVLINDGKELFGDFMQVDMNEENGFMDNPKSDILQVSIKSKKGYMYGDKIIQEQGSIYVTKHMPLKLRSEMFGPDLDTMYLAKKDRSAYAKDSHGDKFKIRTDDLIINSRPEHDTITLKHAELYFNGKKVCAMPSITLHTNKSQDYVEGNYPEFGTMTNLGAYAGPGFVFDTPGGSITKFIPMVNFNSGQLGFGGIAKYKNGTNKTDIAYGTATNMLLVRGKQKLDDNLFLQYGSNTFMDDWFLGFRLPKYMGELVYEDMFFNPDFLGKDKDMTFRHRIAAGYMQDNDVDQHHQANQNSEGGVGTLRFKYMTEVAQTVYAHNSEGLATAQNAYLKDVNKDDILSSRLEMVFQGSAAVYGTGDTQMIARVGPRLHTQYKYWMQDVGYFLSGYNDKTPLVTFDRYMYGRSNAYLRESIRVHKYLTLSWFGSLNLSNDSWNGNLMQENSFFISVGPDDVKINIGYDTVRQQSFITMALDLDAKGTSVEYKKMVIKNPDKLGKDKNGNNNQSNSFSSTSSSSGDEEMQRAEVIDIKEAL